MRSYPLNAAVSLRITLSPGSTPLRIWIVLTDARPNLTFTRTAWSPFGSSLNKAPSLLVLALYWPADLDDIAQVAEFDCAVHLNTLLNSTRKPTLDLHRNSCPAAHQE